MKSRILSYVTATTLLAALAIPVRPVAQEIKPEKPNHHRYKLVNLGTFGGPVGYLNWPGAQVLSKPKDSRWRGRYVHSEPQLPKLLPRLPPRPVCLPRVPVAEECPD